MDEVVMAGGKLGTANSTYYLYNGQYYWTMSPYYWHGNHAYVFCVNYDGRINSPYVHNSYISVRPVINLKNDVTFSGGNGTLDNPYVVQ